MHIQVLINDARAGFEAVKARAAGSNTVMQKVRITNDLDKLYASVSPFIRHSEEALAVANECQQLKYEILTSEISTPKSDRERRAEVQVKGYGYDNNYDIPWLKQ